MLLQTTLTDFFVLVWKRMKANEFVDVIQSNIFNSVSNIVCNEQHVKLFQNSFDYRIECSIPTNHWMNSNVSSSDLKLFVLECEWINIQQRIEYEWKRILLNLLNEWMNEWNDLRILLKYRITQIRFHLLSSSTHIHFLLPLIYSILSHRSIHTFHSHFLLLSVFLAHVIKWFLYRSWALFKKSIIKL